VLFVATDFAWFFLIVLPLAWLTRPHLGVWQVSMAAAGLLFYGWWRHSEDDWWLLGTVPGRYCLYLLVFALVNQGLAVWASAWRRQGRSSTVVLVACIFDLGALFWFKYAEWAVGLLNDNVGTDMRLDQIILPIGVSFISFQALGYVIDVHRGDQHPVTLGEFTSYLFFFPHIVAGPLVRVREFVPQLHQPFDPRTVDASRAFLLIASGFVKKVVISSYVFKNIVEPVFANPKAYGALDNLFAAYGYAVQIYCDFSGYTDIAIGLALLLGIQFPQNFNNPYRALSMQDFWRRWHMSLSRWLRDYLYVSLGGSRKGELRTYVNLFLTMFIGGIWHGANMTFIIWGTIHGVALVIERFFMGRWPISLGPAGAVVRWLATFNIVCLAWIFFNARSTAVALDMIHQILTGWGTAPEFVTPLILFAIVTTIAWQFVPDDTGQRLVNAFSTLPAVSQGIAIGMVMVLCYRFGSVDEFIYFQF
jgi:alginate O-acetyltransferase complex protein AlgI